MKNLIVKDIMTKKVVSASPDTNIVEVARILVKNRFHGLPVTDAGKKLAGIITESDFFVKNLPDLYLPSYIELLRSTGFAKKLPRSEQKKIDSLMRAAARDIMTADCFSIAPDLEVGKLIRIFKQKHFYTIPVIDKNRKVIGIVTLADVIKLI